MMRRHTPDCDLLRARSSLASVIRPRDEQAGRLRDERGILENRSCCQSVDRLAPGLLWIGSRDVLDVCDEHRRTRPSLRIGDGDGDWTGEFTAAE